MIHRTALSSMERASVYSQMTPGRKRQAAPHPAWQTNTKHLYKSFKRSFRDEPLNEALFLILSEAQSKITAWKDSYARPQLPSTIYFNAY